MELKTVFKLVIGSIFSLVLLIGLFGSFYTIDSGERGIVLQNGKAYKVATDGLNFKIPFIEDVKKTSIRTQQVAANASAGTKDLQTVTAQVSVNYRLSESALLQIYSTTGTNLNDSIIAPRVQEAVKAIAANYSAADLLLRREEVKNGITEALRGELARYNVILEATQITNFAFSPAFSQAVENKQIAEQLAQKAKNDLERIKIEGEQRIAQSMAEAKAITVQAEAVRSQGGAEYVQLQFIKKWDGKMPVYGEVPMLYKNVAQ